MGQPNNSTGGVRLQERSDRPQWVVKAALIGCIAAFMIINLYLIFVWAPVATSEHRFNLQRIMYFHVPIAWVALMSFLVIFVASLLYILRKTSKWDALAQSAAEIGVLFSTLVLITGSIWAKGIWDTWWTWEPRLTTMLILWLIYVAYFMVRSYAPNPAQGAKYAAVVGIVGFIDVPIVYFAANWWRGLHPQVVTGPLSDSGSLDPSMRIVLMFSTVTFIALFGYLLWDRFSLRKMQSAIRVAHGRHDGH